MVSSIVSPATKRVVSFLKNLKPVAKSFNPFVAGQPNQRVSGDHYFSPCCGPSLWYPWRRLSPANQGGAFARERQIKELARNAIEAGVYCFMLAAVVGAGSCIALVLGVFSRQALSNPGLLVTSTFLLPIATIIFASIFVYRHTARRRNCRRFSLRPRNTAHYCAFHRDFDRDYAQGSNGTGAPRWTTDRLVTSSADRIQSNLFLHRPQRIDHKTNVLVEIDT
jgi:hypothetical protein